ncbi:MAG: hypothetical protein WCF57_03425 [Pyrinomonadaceae bacterium]
MKIFRPALLAVIALVLIAVVWLWWNRPQRVDMAGYVPADSLIYLEANSLPDIAEGIVSTDAWQKLAPPAGIRSGLGQIGWLSRLSAWTGIGSADAVVLARAQIAVTVLGLDAADEGETLKLKPRYALVVETHTGETRTRAAVEKRIGEFARRAYGEPRVESSEAEGVKFIKWSAPGSERLIVAAVVGSLAVIGNDESAVQVCLAVRRGERPALAGNAQMEEMRRRVGGQAAVAFGYVSPVGSTKLLEIAATIFFGQAAQDPQVQSLIASMLPQLASKVLGSAGWSARFAGGMIEDQYYLSLQNGVAARLGDALASPPGATFSANELLPKETYSLSSYSLRDPQSAWRAFNVALSSQLDYLSSIVVPRLLQSLLKPYGIDEPESFLRAVGSEMVTARLDDAGASTVTIVEARDETALREFVSKKLGPNPRTERVGDVELLISKEEERGAASFVNGRLMMGSETNVRRCLEAKAQAQTLASVDAVRRATRLAAANGPAFAVTFTDDSAPARTFINAIAAQRGARTQPLNSADLERALAQLTYAVSETRLIEAGFERKTRSSFGQFGTLAAQFAK